LVEQNVLSPGLSWLKPSKPVTNKIPNAATLLDLTTLSPEECVLFWKPFKKLYSKKVEHHFGDT
jgi:hypothetical protein